MSTFVDVHVIQTVPPSNMNRDDTGSPKSARYGGVQRLRVSSQAWKRATRVDFEHTLDRSELGVRTKRLVELVAGEIAVLTPEVAPEQRIELAQAVLKETGIKLSKPRKGDGPEEAGYLVFLSHQQVEALARVAVDAFTSGEPIDKTKVRSLIKDKNSIDLALFGRMVADVTDLNVDAAAQVAHALSVHAVEREYDYFTAVDDHKQADTDEDAGAGMIGTVEFASATLYRYATVDVDHLARNLGDHDAAVRAVEAFIRSFVRSLPTGKQNTFANRTLPDAVVVTIRADQPVNLVGAFEEAIPDQAAGGRVKAAVDALVGYAGDVAQAFGDAPVAAWVVGVGHRSSALDALGERTTFEALVPAVGTAVRSRLVQS